jgi:hypothetical protein
VPPGALFETLGLHRSLKRGAGCPEFASIPALKGAPYKLSLGGPFDFFRHIQAVSTITDFQPTMRNNRNLNGAVKRCAVNQDGPRSCP